VDGGIHGLTCKDRISRHLFGSLLVSQRLACNVTRPRPEDSPGALALDPSHRTSRSPHGQAWTDPNQPPVDPIQPPEPPADPRPAWERVAHIWLAREVGTTATTARQWLHALRAARSHDPRLAALRTEPASHGRPVPEELAALQAAFAGGGRPPASQPEGGHLERIEQLWRTRELGHGQRLEAAGRDLIPSAVGMPSHPCTAASPSCIEVCMAIRSFNVGGQRGLRQAAAENLLNLMGIAGPNGSGKSTLLEQLRAQRGSLLEPGSELLYVGPHRTWRSSAVSEVSVLGFDYGFGDVLKQDSIPSFSYIPPGGLQWLAGLARQSASADDAQALVKTAIIRIRNKQQKMLAREFTRQGGEVRPGTVPDFFAPFAELVTTLLPHLEWIGVDDASSQNIRCIFRNSAREDAPHFDIDDLSSGEKAAIGLFLPFIEQRVAGLEGHQQPTPPGIVPVTVLLDEPELHLHPLLQLNALEYMRALAREGQAQFIFATQSPTLLDALDDHELFLLTPAELAADNQLSRLTDSRERLELARSITGSTHLLTRCKPIVFLEGGTRRGGYRQRSAAGEAAPARGGALGVRVGTRQGSGCAGCNRHAQSFPAPAGHADLRPGRCRPEKPAVPGFHRRLAGSHGRELALGGGGHLRCHRAVPGCHRLDLTGTDLPRTARPGQRTPG
jgi:ABC-type cobalamin/Fe3+-siderophores transport system ATPase subunit